MEFFVTYCAYVCWTQKTGLNHWLIQSGPIYSILAITLYNLILTPVLTIWSSEGSPVYLLAPCFPSPSYFHDRYFRDRCHQTHCSSEDSDVWQHCYIWAGLAWWWGEGGGGRSVCSLTAYLRKKSAACVKRQKEPHHQSLRFRYIWWAHHAWCVCEQCVVQSARLQHRKSIDMQNYWFPHTQC